MASRIKGITIEIDGNTSPLQKSLKKVDSQLKTTQNNLKDINKLLKLNPSSTELLTQKQKNLNNAIKDTKSRLEELKKAQDGVKEGTEEWDALQREIIATEQDLKGLEEEHRKFGSVASQQIQAAGKAMQDFGGKVSDAGKKLAPLSGAAAGVLTALGGLAYKAVTSADDLNTLSKQTGISTSELQKFQYASDLIDVSLDDMTGALKKLKPKITEDNKVLQELGVHTKNADGSTRDAVDVFFDAVDALSKIENETEKDQKAMELFGKSADSLAGIIDDGGQALREYGDQAEEMGLILDQDTLDSLNEMNDTIDQLKGNFTGTLSVLGATLAEKFAPVLEKVSGFLQKITEKIRELSPEEAEQIVKVLGIVAIVAPLLTTLGTLITTIGGITTAIGTVVGVLGGPLTLAIMAVIAIGVLLATHWEEVKTWAINTWTALKDGVVEAITAAKEKILEIWGNIKEFVTETVTNIKDTATEKWTTMKNKITETSNNIKTKVTSVWDNIKSTVQGKVDSIKDSISQKFEAMKEKLQGIVDRIKGIFNFDFDLPRLKLPHVDIQWGDGGNGWRLPRFNVQWYRNAYDNPVMFTQPTVLQTPTGLKGFGDGNGAEVVLGLNRLQEMVGAGQGVTINVYPAAGMNETQLAQKIQRVFVNDYNNRRLINA